MITKKDDLDNAMILRVESKMQEGYGVEEAILYCYLYDRLEELVIQMISNETQE